MGLKKKKISDSGQQSVGIARKAGPWFSQLDFPLMAQHQASNSVLSSISADTILTLFNQVRTVVESVRRMTVLMVRINSCWPVVHPLKQLTIPNVEGTAVISGDTLGLDHCLFTDKTTAP